CMLFVGACALGWVSWRVVKRPFRKPVAQATGFARMKLVWQMAGIGFIFILISLPGMITRGAAFRLPDDIIQLSLVSKEHIPFRRPCFGLSPDEIDQEKNVCTLGGQGEPQFVLWGDSHALSLA